MPARSYSVHMSQVLCAFLVVVFAFSGVLAKAEDKWRFREVVFEVRAPDGKPARGVKAFLMGVERNGIRVLDQDTSSGLKSWNFVTDSKGRFTARFGQFESHDYEAAMNQPVPGYGGFYLVAEFPGTAGGVSPYLKNVPENDYPLLSLSEELNEWQKGEFAPIEVANPPQPIVIQLKRGIIVNGSVRDLEGKPVTNCQVGTMHDLHAKSHTGFGGEMLPARASTDANGNYRIEHVYPNRFDLDVAGGVWIKTRVRGGRWKEERVDELMPKRNEKQIRVDLVVVKQPPYRYFGRITNAEGKPVPNAKVTLGVSMHWPPRTHGDDHHYENASTDAKGEYELNVESHFVRGFSVEAPGFKRQDQWGENDSSTPFKPGPYNFQLSK